MKEFEKFCEKVERLRIEESAGRRLGPEDTKFIEAHFEQCSACSLEDRVLAQMAFDESAGPAPQLDDLSCRRWVDSVLERAADPGTGISDERWFGPRAAAALAASVVLVLGLGAVIVFALGDGGEPLEQIEPVAAVSGARLMMSFGDVTRNGDALQLGAAVQRGDRISIGDGGAVLALAEGIDTYLEEGTVAVVRKIDREQVEVVVEEGRVIARVDPGHRGPRLVVATDRGKVFVTGTVLSVQAGDTRHEVKVFRGSVRLEDEHSLTRKVRVGETAVFGEAGVSRYDPEDEAVVSGVLAAMELLSPGDGAAIEVESVPTGAVVKLDGATLGKTPVMACVREGHRRLELSMDSYDSVRELLELGEGAKLRRVFELGNTVDSDSGEAVVASVEEPAREVSAGFQRTATPAELLERAQRLRIEKDWRGAVRAYGELCRAYPYSPEARSALVSKGSIQLEKLGSPQSALSAFDKYLAISSTGTLAQEASFGRARALGALGRTAQEKVALDEFVRDFPSAIQIHRVKARLDQLQ